MLIKKISKALLISISVLGLAACATTSSDAGNGTGSGVDEGVTGVTASGAGDTATFAGPGGPYTTDPMKVGNQSYYFGFDKYDVRSSDLASIKVQANYLIAHPDAKVLVAGNTDERGSREYNIGLGNRRANSVAQVLEMDGVSKNQITTVSYGAEKPVALGHDEAAWAKNRRVDVTYQTPIAGN